MNQGPLNLFSPQNSNSQPAQSFLLHWEKEFLQMLAHKGKSTNTLKNYQTDLNCFNDFLLSKQKDLKIQDFNLTQVREYGLYLEQKYAAENSRRRRVQTLRLFFDFLIEKEICLQNPMKSLPTSPKFLDIPHPPTLTDLQILWNYLHRSVEKFSEQKKEQQLGEGESRGDGPEGGNDNVNYALQELKARRNQLIFVLIYGAGCKVSDLAHLKADHIFQSDFPRILITPPKRDPYSVPLPPIIHKIYPPYLDLLQKEMDRTGLHFSEALFNANAYQILSGGLSPRGLEIIFKDFCRILKINITPKSLRQACILKWLHMEHQESLIKEWMGVAPAYSLKLYRDHLQDQPPYDEAIFSMFTS